MTFYRKDRSGVVWRKTPEEKLTRTIDLKLVPLTAKCLCCGEIKPVSDFYLQSKSRAKHKDHLRSSCVECWDMYLGRLTPEPKEEIYIDVFGEKTSFKEEKKKRKRKVIEKSDTSILDFI